MRSEYSDELEVVRTRWQLSDEERSELAALLPRAGQVTAVEVSRGYPALRRVEFCGLEGTAFPSGRAIDPPPGLFIGAADAPREIDDDWRPDGVLAKIEAGADFFQTQYCFDMAVLRRYIARLNDHGATERAYFLIGIGPLASAKSARWMTENLFGVDVPERLIARLEGAGDQRAEGRRICTELLHELQEIEGVSGAHLMAPRAEKAIAQVIAESGIRDVRLASA